MRTIWIHTESDGITATGGTRDLNKNPLPDSTMDCLASMGLASLTFKYTDGSKMEYLAIEYECEWCGSYSHTGIQCPMAEGVEDEDPGSDSPAID